MALLAPHEMLTGQHNVSSYPPADYYSTSIPQPVKRRSRKHRNSQRKTKQLLTIAEIPSSKHELGTNATAIMVDTRIRRSKSSVGKPSATASKSVTAPNLPSLAGTSIMNGGITKAQTKSRASVHIARPALTSTRSTTSENIAPPMLELRERLQRPWEGEKQSGFAVNCTELHQDDVELEPLRLTVRRPHTSDKHAPVSTTYYPGSGDRSEARESLGHVDHGSTDHSSGLKRSFGQRVKRRLSAMLSRKEPSSSTTQRSGDVIVDYEYATDIKITQRAHKHRLSKRFSLSFAAWPTLQENDVPTVPEELYALQRLSTIKTDGTQGRAAEDAQPLLGFGSNNADDHSSRHDILRHRPSRCASAAPNIPNNKLPDFDGQDERKARSPSTTRRKTSPKAVLTRLLTSAVDKANAEGAFDKDAISARFDSACGSPADPAEQAKASDGERKDSVVASAPQSSGAQKKQLPLRSTSPSPHSSRGRSRTRKVDARRNSTMTIQTEQKEQKAARRHSMWNFASFTGGEPTTSSFKKDLNLAAVANVAGRTLQRSSMLF